MFKFSVPPIHGNSALDPKGCGGSTECPSCPMHCSIRSILDEGCEDLLVGKSQFVKQDDSLKKFITTIWLSILLYTLVFPFMVEASAAKNVLILNSYHQGFKWTDDINRGVLSALEPVKEHTRIFFQYMNTKWVKDDLYFQKLRDIFKHEFATTRFDIIIASDNDAFEFLREYRDEVFGKVPVVFCGVNYLKIDDLDGTTLFTGTSETADLRESLEVALRLHPSARKVFIINDKGISGSKVRDELTALQPVFRGRADFIFEESTDLDTILKDAEALSPDTLIFYTFFYGDPAHKTYENEDCIMRISQHARVPVFGAWDFNLGYGMAGGKLTSGYDQGETAGRMGLKILKGDMVEEITPLLRSPGRYMFDYQQMLRFDLTESALPKDSEVINAPASFRQVALSVIWTVICGILVLSLISLLLLKINRQQKRSEELLQKSHDELELTVAERTRDLTELNKRLCDDIESRRRIEQELQDQLDYNRRILDSRSAHIAIVGGDGVIIDVNAAWRRFAEASSGEDRSCLGVGASYFQPSFTKFDPDGAVAKALDGFRKVQTGELSAFQMDYPCHSLMGEPAWFSMEVLPLLSGKGAVIVSHREITARKRAEEALEKRLVALTRPLDDAEGVSFEHLFNLEDIQRLQEEFAEATGVASIITRPDGTPITRPSKFCRLCQDVIRKTEKGLANCFRSDAVIGRLSGLGPTIQPCMSGGLWDAGAGISVGGRHVANWLIGQVRDEAQTAGSIAAYADQIGADVEDAVSAFQEVPAMSRERFTKVARVLYTIADRLSAIAYQNVQQARFIAELKEAEAALREKHSQLKKTVLELEQARSMLQLVIESIPVRVFWKDRDSRFLGCNNLFARDAGFDHPDALLGKDDFAMSWAEQADLYRADDRAVMESGLAKKNIIEPQSTRTGAKIWLNTSKVPLCEPGGEVIGVLGVYSDISEHLRMERITQARLRLLELAVSHSLDELVTATLDEIENLTGSSIGFYHFLDVDQKTLSLQSWSTNTLKTLCTAAGKGSHYEVMAAGVWVDCIHEQRPVIHNDYGSLTHRKGMPEGHAPVIREIVCPIFRGDRIVAIIGTGNKPADYDENDIEIVSQVGDLSWDIIERKLMEQAVALRDQQYKTLAENSPDLVVRFDKELRRTYVNPAWERASGLKAEEVLHVSAAEIPWILKRAAPEFLEKLKQVFAGAGPQKVEFCAENARGEMLALDYVIVPEYDRDGAIVSALAVGHDISERKQAEDLRIRLQTQLAGALEMARLGPWEYDVINDRFTFNDHFYRIFRTSAEQVGGYFMSSAEYGSRFVHPEDMHLVAEEIEKCIETMDPHFSRKLDHRMIYADGNVGYISVQFYVEKDYQGRTVKTYGVNQDITEQKRGEEEREKLQAQLNQVQKLESVGRLAGGVAHDFNNMLGVILGHAELAMVKIEQSHVLFTDLDQIRKTALRSADLTRQLLAFARRQTISPRILNLNHTVEGMLKILQRLIGEDIDLAWFPANGLWPVKVDPSQVDQILANLCVNARDAILGVGKITIETGNTLFNNDYCIRHPGFPPGKLVMLAVSDNGCGMDQETIGKIFEPFYTTKAMGKGTGLGLATVYGIVKQNNGFINVYSEPGQGTTFKIYLPRTEEEPAEEQAVLVKRELRGKETVLLVEDEEAILALGKTILQRYGYEVLASRSPTEALRMAQSHPGPIHLLITDVVMPEMNGKDLKGKLAELRSGLKSIFMSGYTANVIAHHGILDKGIDFLQKPFSVQTLLEKIRDVLDG